MKKIRLDYPYTTITFLGGTWYVTSFSGSRCSSWVVTPSNSSGNVSSRGVSDHFKG